jgi:hypothetical protein
MRGENEVLQGGRELNFISQKDPYNGSLLSKMIDAINAVAKHAGVAAVGKVPPPPRIDSINVQGTLSGSVMTCPSEILHWTLNHNQAISKGVRYISEVDTDPNFPSPHVIDHGCSRSAFLHLPTNQNDGVTPNVYYLRSYAQYPGGDPCAPTVHGNLGGAIQIKMTGGTNPSATSLLTSTGSGTAAPNGQQGGHGLGVVLDRPAPGPKRNVS